LSHKIHAHVTKLVYRTQHSYKKQVAAFVYHLITCYRVLWFSNADHCSNPVACQLWRLACIRCFKLVK